jgi:hypothetical protein
LWRTLRVRHKFWASKTLAGLGFNSRKYFNTFVNWYKEGLEIKPLPIVLNPRGLGLQALWD